MNGRIMKKTSISKSTSRKSERTEMQSEYRFDYRKAHTNRFAGKMSKERVVVLLDPDVSKVFTTPDSVNAVLRAVVTALPAGRRNQVR